MADKIATRPAAVAASTHDVAPWELLSKRQVVLTMGGVMLAMFLASLDQTIVGTAMPRIIGDLGGFDKYTWVTTSYLVASTTPVPLVGRLSDMYGRKWFFIGGIAIFLIGSALSGLSQSMTELILFRGIQGVGAGIMMANAFVAIGDLFPPTERGKFQGIIGGVFGLSSVIGPWLGGIITDNFSWHWIFYVNLPLGIPALALFVLFFPHTVNSNRTKRIDYLGGVLLIATIIPLLVGLSWGGTTYPWKSVQIEGLLGAAAILAFVFFLVERRVAEPILPPEIFKNRVVSVSFLAIFLTGFVMMGSFVFIPLFFQGALGFSATSSGSFLTPMMLGLVTGGIISGQALSRFGGHYRIQGIVGMAIMVVGLFMLSRMTLETSHVMAIVNIIVMGLGLGITMPLFTIAVQNAVDFRLMGVATSSTQFIRSVGGVLGLALFGSFMVSKFGSLLGTNVPDQVKQALPPGTIEALAKNPQATLSGPGLQKLQEAFAQAGPQGAQMAGQLVHAIKVSLASAITDVFLIGVVVAILALITVVFLKEIPLRKSGRGAPAARPSPAVEA